MYAILRAKKIKTKSQITNASEHNLRLRNQNNIDSDRSELNQILFNPLGIDQKSPSSFQEKLSEFYSDLGVKEKKDNVLLYEYVATASPDFFKNKSVKQIRKWASDQVKFMKDQFGTQLKLAVLHLDERTPHVHFFVSTELKSVKKYKNRYGECEKETWSLNSNRYDPDFLIELQTKFALANKPHGLIRGVKGSMRKNVPLKKFYKMVDKVMSTSYKKSIDELINKIELDFGERLSINTIRDKIRVHLSPYLNGLTKQQKGMKEILKLDLHTLQTDLIEDKNKIKIERENINARKEIYKEAINKDLEKSIEIKNLFSENEKLKLENLQMKNKYEPDKLSDNKKYNIENKLKI